MSVDGTSATFGDLLRRYRLAAGLTQEVLAEKAQVSARAISDLERGQRSRPWRETVQLLATALGLDSVRRAELEAAARRSSLPPAATAASPPSADATPPRTNLPIPITSFVGREREIVDVGERLAATRLLTLTGTGGCGKTRLALQVASGLVSAYPDGVWLVELAPLADPALVVGAVASVLAVREAPGHPLRESVLAFLRARRLLLILDNCEHLIDACADLAAAILRTCPQVSLLVTSRESLRIGGETNWRVPSLTIPRASSSRASDLLASEAVRLYRDRARSALPAFALDEHNAKAVAEICRQLDGIPLAIELAAARVGVLGVEQTAARLDQRFRLLTRGSRAALPRQQTLAATVDWSYDLLTEPERRLFNRLSVFAGGFTLEAAETTCGNRGAGPDDSGARHSVPSTSLDVLDLLGELVDKSMVQAEPDEGGALRYRLLETLRQYGKERLAASGEAESIRERHAAYFTTHTQAMMSAYAQSKDFGPYVTDLSREMANVRAAAAWYHDQRIGEEGLRLILPTGEYWDLQGPPAEGWTWVRRFMSLADAQPIEPLLRAGALFWAGDLNFRLGDMATGQRYFEQMVDLVDSIGLAYGATDGRQMLGWVLLDQSKLSHAQVVLQRGLEIARELEGKHPGPATVRSLLLLGDAQRLQGDYRGARAWYEACGSLEPRYFYSDWVARNLGFVALREGNTVDASAFVRRALQGYQQENNTIGLLECITAFAAIAAEQRHDHRAARLVGALEAGLDKLGAVLYFGDRFEHQKTLATLRARLPDDVLATEMERGRAMTLEQAVAYAREANAP